MKTVLPGINIQFPISELILSGDKIIETRTYPLPTEYENKRLYFVETPGKKGKFKSRVVAVIIFEKSFKYQSKTAFSKDKDLHKVYPNSEWDWKDKPKWGWPIKSVKKLPKAITLSQQKGIRFTKRIEL